MKLVSIILITLTFGLSSLRMEAQVPPPLVSPVDNSVCEDMITNFDWEATVNSLDYTLQVTSVSGSYTSPEIDEAGLTTSNFQATLPNLETTYYWRVAARYSNTITWSEERTFDTKKASTEILFPTDDSQCNDLIFATSWLENPAFDSYNVQIANNSGFIAPEVDLSSVTGASASSTLSSYNTNYYARISGNYTSGTTTCVSVWSDPIQFVTVLEDPNLTEPLNKAIGQTFDLNFDWDDMDGALTYDFQLSEDLDFSTFVSNQTNIGTSAAFVSLDEDKFNTIYYWRAKSINDDPCASEWSETFEFRTNYQSSTLTAPENNIECAPLSALEFTWESVPGANTYNIQVSDQIDFANIVLESKELATTSTLLDIPGDLKIYYWRVRAEDAVNFGIWSDSRKFTTGIFSPRAVYPLSSDENVFIAPEFQWTIASNYTFMRLQVSSDMEFSNEGVFFDSAGHAEVKMDVILPEYQTQYYWRTSSTYNNCESGWSNIEAFTTFNGYPELLSPVDNATNQKVNLRCSWGEVEKRTSFDFAISVDPNFETVEDAVFGNLDNNYYPQGLKPGTRYYWRVRTRNPFSFDKTKNQSVSPWSPTYSFNTGLAANDSPVLLTPEFQEKKIQPQTNLTWAKGTTAESYRVQFSIDELFNSTMLDTTNVLDTTITISGLDNYKRYYWRVKALNITDTSDWSDIWWFRTIAPLPANAPLLVSPENDITGQAIEEVYFQWLEVDNVSKIDGGTYNLQVVKGTDFDNQENVIYNETLTKISKSIFSLESEVLYSWRVLARNEAGDSDFSEVWNFTTNPNSVVDGRNYFDTEIYPNPANAKTSIRLNLKSISKLEIELYDTKGQLIKKILNTSMILGDNIINIDLSGIAKGAYLIKINTTEEAEIHQIIIN